MSELSWRHHTLIQALISRGPLKESEFRSIFTKITGKSSDDHQLFHHFLKKINANLSYVQFELRAFRNQYDGTVYYGVVNNVADEQSKLGTKYTVPQIAFYKGIVSIGSESQPQGGSSQVPAAFKNFSLSQKERTLEELVQDKWLCTTLDGNVGLGVRSFMDLRSWFRNNDVPACDVCNEAGVKADLCPNESCTVRIHNYCLTRTFSQRKAERVCPGCGAKWKFSMPKNERVEEEDIPNGSSQNQPPPEPTMRKKLRSCRTGDVDTGRFGSSQTSTFMPEAKTTRRSSRLTSASQS